MNPISAVLTLWKAGSISDKDVAVWANDELVKADVPSPELIDLVCDGPARCLRRSQADFPYRAIELSYQDQFTLWAHRLKLDDKTELGRFVNWVACASMGEDLNDELVKFGYQLDHLIGDCNDEKAAIAYAKGNLPSLKPFFAQHAMELLTLVPHLVSIGTDP